MIRELINTMKEQLLCYDFLLGLSKEKTEVVVNNELEQLKKITDTENEYVCRCQSLERQRLDIIDKLAKVFSTDANSLNVSAIADMVDNIGEKDELLSVSAKIRKSIESLKEVNDRNKILIANSLDYIDYSMNVIRTSVEKEPACFDPDNSDYINNHSFFDAKQ